MGQLEITFVGVNAYVPEYDEGKLVVYMPNGTQWGADSTKSSLVDAHRPTVWRVDGNNQLINPESIRYFPWGRMSLAIKGGDAAQAIDLTKLKKKDVDCGFSLSGVRAGKPPYTAGVVELSQGKLEVEKCLVTGWQGGSGTPPNKDYVIKQLKVSYESVRCVVADFAGLDQDTGNAETLKFLLGEKEKVRLMVGNVCAEYILAWEKTNQHRYPDVDFGWLHEITDPKSATPIPIMEELKYSIQAHDDYVKVLEKFFPVPVVIGGIGCECSGIVADFKPR